MKKKSKDEEEQRNILIRVVRSYFKITTTKKNVDNAFAEEKNDFENAMDVLYDRFSSEDGNVYVDNGDATNPTKIRVHKTQTSKVLWNIDKLKKLLGKDSETVVTKKYEIVNFPLLIKLAKEYKIPWNKFKKCIEYEEVVNDAALDKLIDLGIVDGEESKKCATVKLNKPYYKLTEQ